MAKINDTTTYPNTAPALTDHVPGTDVSNTANDANGETVTFTWQSVLDLFEGNLSLTADLRIAESADHSATPTAGIGQIWVRNDTPNVLVFTDDAGTDHDVLFDTSGATLSTKSATASGDDYLIFDGAAGDAPKLTPHTYVAGVSLIVPCSDETTDLTTGTAKRTFRMPFAMTLTDVRASVTTAPTGANLVVDINEGGATILSTKLSIDATEKTSTTAATAAVISDAALADDAEITIDIDQIGSTVAGAGLKVTLIGYRT